MLIVDLVELDRLGRLQIETELPAEFLRWPDGDITLDAPLEVRLEARRAGRDLLVEGSLTGEVIVSCRRCLEPVHQRVEEDLSLFFRAGVDRLTAERDEVYQLPEGAREVDLTEPVHESLILAIPRYVECRAECRGLCPRCGVNLNDGTCSCDESDTDERWSPFHGLKLD